MFFIEKTSIFTTATVNSKTETPFVASSNRHYPWRLLALPFASSLLYPEDFMDSLLHPEYFMGTIRYGSESDLLHHK